MVCSGITKLNISEALISIVRGSSDLMRYFVMQMQISYWLSSLLVSVLAFISERWV